MRKGIAVNAICVCIARFSEDGQSSYALYCGSSFLTAQKRVLFIMKNTLLEHLRYIAYLFLLIATNKPPRPRIAIVAGSGTRALATVSCALVNCPVT